MVLNPPEIMYEFTFSVWPDETSPRMRNCPSVFSLFKLMTNRVVMEFTDKGFADFREEIAKVGLTLREIEKIPHHHPISVR